MTEINNMYIFLFSSLFIFQDIIFSFNIFVYDNDITLFITSVSLTISTKESIQED